MAQKLSFAVNDIRLEDTIDKSQFAVLSVDAFATGRSAHDTYVTDETLKRTAKTILLKPFVFAIDKAWNDLGTHTKDEVPGGFVPHDSPIEFKTLDDGRLMMTCRVLVWKRYSGKLLEYFSRDGNRKGVSVEIEVIDAQEDPKTGLLEIKDFIYNAITALGDLIRPAIPNAEAVLQFSKEFEDAKQEYEFASKYDEVDFTIPAGVKTNAAKALETYKQKGRGATSVSLAMARYLAREAKITPEKVRQIKKFFDKKNINPDDISFGLFGGKDGAKWAFDLVSSIDDIDNKKTSYFSDDGNNNPEPNVSSFEDKSNEKEELNMAKDKNAEQVAVEETPEELNMAADSAEDQQEEKPAENQEEMAADSAEEKQEDKAGEQEPDEEFAFSFDASAAMALMADQEMCKMACEEMAKGKDADFSVIAHGMYAAMSHYADMCKAMAADKEVYLAENEELKKFKADVENEKKQFAVSNTLKELNSKVIIPDDAMEAMLADANNYSFADLEEWKKVCKAKCIDFAFRGKTEESNINRMQLPFVGNVSGAKSLWIAK